jgi:outer membrane receptor for ferrienterochelin and colicin
MPVLHPHASRPHQRTSFAIAFALNVALPIVAAPALATDLAALSLEDLMDLQVVGASKYEQRPADVAASVSVITREEIQAHGWRTIDEALSSLPGVTTTDDRQYVEPNLRGFGLPGDYSTRVLVTINGNRLNDPVHDQGPFGRVLPLDMDLVERIEYIPGPGGAVYGPNAMFGVVNIVTRGGADVAGTELSVTAEEPQEQREGRVSWGQKLAGGTDVLVSASDLQANGEDLFYHYGVTGISGVAAGLDYERDRQLFVRAQNDAWSIEAEYGARRKGDPTASYSTDPLMGKYLEDDLGVAQLHYHQGLADETLQLSARFFAGDYHLSGEGSIFGTPYSQQIIGEWAGTELQLLSTAVDRHKFMVGLEIQDNYRLVQGSTDPTLSENVYIAGSSTRSGLYFQDEWHASEAVAATLGVRVENDDADGTDVSPRAGLIWQSGPATALIFIKPGCM